MLADKLGLAGARRRRRRKLLKDLFELLRQVETDMTLFFRLLNDSCGWRIETLTGAGGVEPPGDGGAHGAAAPGVL